MEEGVFIQKNNTLSVPLATFFSKMWSVQHFVGARTILWERAAFYLKLGRPGFIPNQTFILIDGKSWYNRTDSCGSMKRVAYGISPFTHFLTPLLPLKMLRISR